jgi:hypothetical protein
MKKPDYEYVGGDHWGYLKRLSDGVTVVRGLKEDVRLKAAEIMGGLGGTVTVAGLDIAAPAPPAPPVKKPRKPRKTKGTVSDTDATGSP